MRKCVVFDLDGTLADTSGDLIAAANACFEGMGRAVRLDPVADAGVGLLGGKAMLRLGLEREGALTEDLLTEWYPHLLRFYGDALCVHTRMYDGAVEAVEALRSADHAVSVCTNKPEALAEALLRALGVRDLFGALVGADTLPTRKPDVAPYWAAVERAGGARGASLLVGDSDTDRNTARAAGRPCVLVTFAPGGQAVHALEPEGVIDRFEELHPEVDRLLM
ncbi:HAD hydrolase-like protein [Ponticoccus sp. (in: a-proteobacteria)]|uniref:HAD hydrolase-like protein n=1 Tax=Ponticoccus sp. (in: a-proteobacteria) TaxID=1925025 RepID=UPI003AB2A370